MAQNTAYHDDETMNKVYMGMQKAGIPRLMIPDVVNCIMNEGILFRELERKPVIKNDPPALSVPPYTWNY